MTFNIFGNTTDTVSWTPNPTARGTSNILQSCLLTMSLCVWTAVHLNIQERDNPRFAGLSYQTWRKIGWLILGLLAPEMLVYTAWSQREEAKRSMDAYNEAFGCTTTPGLFSKGGKCGRIFRKGLHMLKRKTSNPNGQEPQPETEKPQGWTMTQGFYAQMGGFVLDTTGDHLDQSIREDLRNSLPGARTTLSVHYFCNLMRYEFTTKDWIIADALKISRQDISDKSKASGLAKTLVCFQALWFCIQCFARVSQNLPITLLELNSFAHSACALLVYILWWEKPLDVEQSTSLPVSDMQTIRIWARMNESRCFKCLGKEPRTLQNILSNRLYSFLGLPTQTLSTSSSLHGQTVPLSPVDTPEDTPFNLPRYLPVFFVPTSESPQLT
ncbi:hypothetical protein GGR54DRAFT_123665 [Hypoxylon sp. NC1633]|nr:hypothetical protein GGR54DRAFT_123665 [Hypoxylon sp. NC1633]